MPCRPSQGGNAARNQENSSLLGTLGLLVNRTSCGCGNLFALIVHVNRDLTWSAAEILTAVLFLGGLAVFLLYVPALSLVVVVSTLLGLASMFVLGFQAGRGAIRFSRARKAHRSGLAH